MSEELMQFKNKMAMVALYAVPSKVIDVLWLVHQPDLLSGFHTALKALPDSHQRLSGLALWARLCLIDLERARGRSPSHLKSHGPENQYCNKAQSDGIFDVVYSSLQDMFKVWQL